MVEKFNHTIDECLAKLIADKEKEWDKYVESVLFAYRIMKHNTTELSNYKNIKDALMERLFKIINLLEDDQQIALN
ncbi:1022_t:CDS:2 [Funneliformis geosporum]|uniref:1022_t:CDS:1 n=1 Tax=Funneliformis geosporum TaxID=1117311 RepID=A0A9W4SBW4_9GLOM|nr:1022_t:CDS:2 [Funneliformis geosporum]